MGSAGPQIEQVLTGCAGAAGVHPRTMTGILLTLLVILGYLALKRVIKAAVRRRVEDPARRFTVVRGLLFCGCGILLCIRITRVGRFGLG